MSNRTMVRDDRSYIEYVGDGLYAISGDGKSFYLTGYEGALAAHEALVEAAKNYVYVK